MEISMLDKRMMTAAAAFLVVAGLAGSSLAGEDDGTGWGIGRMMRSWGMGSSMMDMGPDAMLDRIDGRLAFLKTELAITATQQPAWDELASVVRTTAETHNAMMRTMMVDMRSGELWKKPLPDRLTLQETHLSARLEQVKITRAAVEKLYALLSDDQKKAADEIVLPMMGMGMGRGMGPATMMP